MMARHQAVTTENGPFVRDAAEPLWQRARREFSILQRRVNKQPLIYLDSAATSLRPDRVIEAEADFYRLHNANVHRGLHRLAAEADALYESARHRLKDFIGAGQDDQLVWTRNCTAAINMVARGLDAQLQAGDEILLTEAEHHANLVPWIQLAKRRELKLRHIPFDNSGQLDLNAAAQLIGARTKVVAFAHSSNVLGTIHPVQKLVELTRAQSPALILLDAAQAFAHQDVNFNSLSVDFMTFSAHKAYGPMGVGALVGKTQALELLEPMESGGSMIDEVYLDSASWADLPQRLEAGTPNAAGVSAVSAALDLITDFGGPSVLRAHEQDLTRRALDALQGLGGLRIVGPLQAGDRAGLISFVDDSVHPHDMASMLDQAGIAVRAGHHCAQPLHRKLGLVASNRVSFALHNSPDEIDALIDAIRDARSLFA